MKTVRARIPIVVNEKGVWAAYAYSKFPEKENVDCVMEGFDEFPCNEIIHYVEVNLPIPESSTIVGEIVKSVKEEPDVC